MVKTMRLATSVPGLGSPPPTSVPGPTLRCRPQVRIPRADAVEGDSLHARAVPGVHGLPVDQGPHPRQPPLDALTHVHAVQPACGWSTRHDHMRPFVPASRFHLHRHARWHRARRRTAEAMLTGHSQLVPRRPAGPFGKESPGRVGPSPGRRRQASGHGPSQPHAARGSGRRVAASAGPAGQAWD